MNPTIIIKYKYIHNIHDNIFVYDNPLLLFLTCITRLGYVDVKVRGQALQHRTEPNPIDVYIYKCIALCDGN